MDLIHHTLELSMWGLKEWLRYCCSNWISTLILGIKIPTYHYSEWSASRTTEL